MKIVACYSIKGGVGKTAASVNLAYAAAALNQKTLLIDLDPQGASSFYFRVRPSDKLKGRGFFTAGGKLQRAIRGADYPNLDILPANMAFRKFDLWLSKLSQSTNRLAKVLRKFRKDYDLVILDCPPGITLLSENVFTAADMILLPVIPTTLSERTFKQLLQFFSQKSYSRKKLFPFFTMVQKNNRLHRQTMARLTQAYRRFLTTAIPLSVDVERMGLQRKPVLAYAPKRPAALAYQALCEEVLNKL